MSAQDGAVRPVGTGWDSTESQGHVAAQEPTGDGSPHAGSNVWNADDMGPRPRGDVQGHLEAKRQHGSAFPSAQRAGIGKVPRTVPQQQQCGGIEASTEGPTAGGAPDALRASITLADEDGGEGTGAHSIGPRPVGEASGHMAAMRQHGSTSPSAHRAGIGGLRALVPAAAARRMRHQCTATRRPSSSVVAPPLAPYGLA